MIDQFPPSQETTPNFYILESLSRADEEANRFEGKFLYNYLNLLDKKPKYIYFRTKRELIEISNYFRLTGYRYLYLSCHGNENSIFTTFDEITFEDFAEIFEKKLNNRRLFLSGCSLGQSSLAEALFSKNGGMYSITAPIKDVTFIQTLPFWSTFFYLMDSIDTNSMKLSYIEPCLHHCVNIFNMKIVHFYKDNNNTLTTLDFTPEDIFSEKAINKFLHLKNISN